MRMTWIGFTAIPGPNYGFSRPTGTGGILMGANTQFRRPVERCEYSGGFRLGIGRGRPIGGTDEAPGNPKDGPPGPPRRVPKPSQGEAKGVHLETQLSEDGELNF